MSARKSIFIRRVAGIGPVAVLLSALFLCVGASGTDQRVCTPGLIPDVLVYSELLHDEIGTGQYAVIVDKNQQKLHLFEFQGRWRLMNTWPCSTGKKAGRKEKEGDLKTPEGVYFAVRHVPDRYLSAIYGAHALPLNYPDWLDRSAGRTGSAIWLHGTDKALRARDSNGCVVLANEHISALASKVQLHRTPVIIVDRMRWWRQQEADRWAVRLKKLVAQWQDDLMGGSYKKYKRWYEPGASATMEWWHQWCRLRNLYGAGIGQGRISARNFDIYKYDNIFLIQFHQTLTIGKMKTREAANTSVTAGVRRLYVQSLEGRLRLIGDMNFSPGVRQEVISDTDPLFNAWRVLARTVNQLPQNSKTILNDPESSRKGRI